MNAELEKVVERFELLAVDHEPDGWPAVRMRDLTLAAKALRDQDAELARLRNVANEYNQCIRHMSGGGDFFEFQRDITAHLGGEHE